MRDKKLTLIDCFRIVRCFLAVQSTRGKNKLRPIEMYQSLKGVHTYKEVESREILTLKKKTGKWETLNQALLNHAHGTSFASENGLRTRGGGVWPS